MSDNLPTNTTESTNEETENSPPSHVSVYAQAETYAGAVPPPNVLATFEQYAPGAAERFLLLAELEQQSYIEARKERLAILRQEIDLKKAEQQSELERFRTKEKNATANFRYGLAASFFLMCIFVTIPLPKPNKSSPDKMVFRTARQFQPLFIKFPLVANNPS
jgi:hypothetical protein